MASHYDEKAKCRVGTMDDAQFYAECDKGSSLFFKSLIAAWRKGGGELKWGAGGVGLRAPLDDKEVGVCFLAPKYAGKKDRIELACAGLTKQIGAKRCDQLRSALQSAAGEHALGTSMLSVTNPGELPAAGQKAIQAALASLLQRWSAAA